MSDTHSSNDSFNVLLLSLSTFSSNPTIKEYKLPKSTFVFNDEQAPYFYQLEPVPKMLAKELNNLDHIVMLATQATLEAKNIILTNPTKPDSGVSKFISAEGYMRECMRDLLTPSSVSDSQFETIIIDEEQPAEGIGEAVNHLRALNKNHSNLRLYLDVHGGFRDAALVLEAMVTLLRNEIKVQEIYTVHYNNTERIGTIKIDSAAKIFDFVSGINEFTNYGRIDSLRRYYRDNPSSEAQTLITHITDIASGIQLCDISKFEAGLDQLRYYFNSSALTNDNSYKPLHYLQLFKQVIYNDYGELLNENRTTIEEINWCLKKGFYQQCLTLIESRMPEEMYRIGLFEYDQNSLGQYADTHHGYYSKNLFIFNHSVPSSIRRALNITGPNCNAIFENRLFTYLKNQTYQQIRRTDTLHRKARVFERILKFHDCDQNQTNHDFQVRVDSAKIINVFSFLLLHTALKYLRNLSNHAGNNSIEISLESIKSAIETYTKWFSEFCVQ